MSIIEQFLQGHPRSAHYQEVCVQVGRLNECQPHRVLNDLQSNLVRVEGAAWPFDLNGAVPICGLPHPSFYGYIYPFYGYIYPFFRTAPIWR
jgi:hypothetical protein